MSVSYLSFFEKVSDLFLEIGKFTEINHELAVLFPHSLSLKALAFEYLSVVMQIATKIFNYAQKSRTKQVFSSVFADFATTFGPLTTKLQTLAESIKSGAMVEAAKMNQLEHSNTQKGLHQLMSFSRHDSDKKGLDDWRYRIAQHLGSGAKNYGHKWSYYFGKGRSSWLLTSDDYLAWRDATSSRTFWLHGKLGSGKSVALASICSDLTTSVGFGSRDAPSTVSYFFCKDGETRSALASTIMDSIVAQIVTSSTMASAFDIYLKEVGGPKALEAASDSCVEFLLSFTPDNWKCCIVIDGLDQLSSNEAQALFNQLVQLSKLRCVLLCCSSHPTWEPFRKVEPLLFDAFEFSTSSMDNIDRSPEANDFVEAEMSKWERRGWHFPSSDAKERVIQALMSHWDNMFLWLKLQMELIEEDLRDEDGYEIEYILARIHDDLSSLYERRLAEVAKANNPLSANILKLVVGADPAMKVNELRIAANITPGDTDWSPVSLPKNGAALCSKHGGKLLEVDEATDEVRLIHGSVAVHLCGPPRSELTAPLHFSFEEARTLVGLVCITYLNMPNLNQSLAVRPRSAEPGPRQTSGMATVAHNVIDDSGLDRHLLAPVIRGTRGRLNNSLDASAFLGNIVTRQAAAYVLTDFSDYAKTNVLTVTRSLSGAFGPEVMMKVVMGGNTIPKHLAKVLRDPKTGVLWAIDQGHRPLFSQYVIDRQTSKVHLSKLHNFRLMNLLLYEWDDVEYIGPRPLLIAFSTWLYAERPAVFKAHSGTLLRILHNSKAALAQQPDLTRLKQTKISGDVAWELLVCLLKSSVPPEEFAATLQSLKSDLKDRIEDEAIVPDDGNSLLNLTPLAYVVQNEFDAVQRIHALASAGASPNSSRRDRQSFPLFIAVDKGNLEIIEVLLFHGADIHTRLEAGDEATPLILAVKKQRLEVITYLLNQGARISHRDTFGSSPLHYAAKSGNLAVLECLLKFITSEVFDIDDMDNFGSTALFDAFHGGHRRCAEALLRAGARRLLAMGDSDWNVNATRDMLRMDYSECLLKVCPKLDDFILTGVKRDEDWRNNPDHPLLVLEDKGAIVRVSSFQPTI